MLNRKADEVYRQQKDKEAKLFDQLMQKQRSMLLSEENSPGCSSVSANHHNTDFRQSVENRKQLLDLELYDRLEKITVKHETKSIPRSNEVLQLSSSLQRENTTDMNRRIREVQQRKHLLEENLFRTKLEKLIEKEEKIRDIVEGPRHYRQASANDELGKESDREMLTKPQSLKTTYVAKEPDRSTLLQKLTQSQSKVLLRKETLLRQLSE